MNDVVGRVPVQDLRDPLVHVDPPSVRAGRHVAVGQGRHCERGDVVARELRAQLLVQTALLRLDQRARVVGHQCPQPPITDPGITQVARPVERVEPAVDQRLRVPDVVQPGGSLDDVRLIAQDPANHPRLSGDALAVGPALR